MSNKKDEKKKQVLPTQPMLFLRGFIGFYLIYLAYDLFRDESMVAPRISIYIFALLFTAAGIFLIVWIIRSWIRGEYVGGPADISAEEEYTEYEEDFAEDEKETE